MGRPLRGAFRRARTRPLAALLLAGLLLPGPALASDLEIRLYRHGSQGKRVVYVTRAIPAPASGEGMLERWLVDLPNALFSGGTVALGSGEPIDDLEVLKWSSKTIRLGFSRLAARPPERMTEGMASPARGFGIAHPSLTAEGASRLYANLSDELDAEPRQVLPEAQARQTARMSKTATATPWRWRSSSQVLVASNVQKFAQGPSALGASLSLRGSAHQGVPWARGILTGHVEQHALKFTDARFNYGSLTLAAAMNHPITPSLYLFEGAAMFFSQADYSPMATFLDNSLYAGIGTHGALPFGGVWVSSLTADRVLTQSHRDSYYGQAARLGISRAIAPGLTLQAMGTAQRVDPIVRAIPYTRTMLQASLESEVRPGWALGVKTLAGAQFMPEGTSGFAHAGPFLQIRF